MINDIYNVIPHKSPLSAPLFLVRIRVAFLKRTSSRNFKFM